MLIIYHHPNNPHAFYHQEFDDGKEESTVVDGTNICIGKVDINHMIEDQQFVDAIIRGDKSIVNDALNHMVICNVNITEQT